MIKNVFHFFFKKAKWNINKTKDAKIKMRKQGQYIISINANTGEINRIESDKALL